MLPVTCVLTRTSATVEHEVQIWNAGALNCMTFPYDLIKHRQPRYKAMSSVTLASVDVFGCLGDLQPLHQLPRGCREAHKRGRRGGGEEGRGGGLYPFTRLAVAHNDGGVHAQSRSDLMQERK